jgi:hypothetical protein
MVREGVALGPLGPELVRRRISAVRATETGAIAHPKQETLRGRVRLPARNPALAPSAGHVPEEGERHAKYQWL